MNQKELALQFARAYHETKSKPGFMAAIHRSALDGNLASPEWISQASLAWEILDEYVGNVNPPKHSHLLSLALDALQDMVILNCRVDDTIVSGHKGFSTGKAIYELARHDRLFITEVHGGRVIGKWINKEERDGGQAHGTLEGPIED